VDFCALAYFLCYARASFFFMLVLQKNPVPYLVPCSVISPFATVSEAWGASLCL